MGLLLRGVGGDGSDNDDQPISRWGGDVVECRQVETGSARRGSRRMWRKLGQGCSGVFRRGGRGYAAVLGGEGGDLTTAM